MDTQKDVNAHNAALRRSSQKADGLRWQEVPIKQYKEEGSHFRNITRQILFGEETGLSEEVRYFEIKPGGHSTFERHHHVHAVAVIQGRGQAIIGTRVERITPYDLVFVPPLTWHQFLSDDDAPLGFLCISPCDRDRPVRPGNDEARQIRSDPRIGRIARL